MDDVALQHTNDLPIPTIAKTEHPTIADQVFTTLQQRILSLELPPRTRLSEADVARRMGVSRQPVREAFKRLAKMGFLNIRPQSSTTVSLISEEAVQRARFIRIALEVQTCRTACEKMNAADIAALNDLLTLQRAAVEANDRERFHTLDDQFHREICIRSGVGYVWDLIHDSKGHMDRIRMLSLNQPSQQLAYDEHVILLNAISARDPDAAAAALVQHLSRILVLIKQFKSEKHEWFSDKSI